MGTMKSHSEMLAAFYEQHHSLGKRYDFVFGGTERAQILARWIGTGKKVLDVGCRDGALTRYFTEANQVAGLDIDRVALAKCSANLGMRPIGVMFLTDCPLMTRPLML